MTRDKIFLLGEFAFIFGIFLFPFFQISLWVLLAAAGFMLSLVFLTQNGKAQIIFLALLFFIVGLARYSVLGMNIPNDEKLGMLNGKEVRMDCIVVEIPEIKKGKQKIVLEIKNSAPIKGRILAYADAYADYSYGDAVYFRGKLSVPESFEDFDYRAYLRSRGIYLISYYPELVKTSDAKGFYHIVNKLRRKVDDNIRQVIPSPAGNIVSAMTIGTESEEIEEVMEKFNQTGTSHVIAVSGYHMVVVAAILTFVLRAFGAGRLRRFYLVILGIFCFVILSGSQPSAIRSAIMAGVFLFASQVGRGGDAFRALIFSAAAMIFADPRILAGDIGFQLSFLATFGLIAILPMLEKRFEEYPHLAGIKEMFLMTLAAQIAVFPILVINFGQFSFLSLLANILILPTVPAVMIGGFLLIGASLVSMFLAKVIAFPVYFLTIYEIEVVDILSRIDWGIIRF
jgi:competence protein ComEC